MIGAVMNHMDLTSNAPPSEAELDLMVTETI